MCGRFTLVPGGAEQVPDHFDVSGPAPPPRWNLAPSQESGVVRPGQQGRELAQLDWGWVPSWAKEGSASKRLINARSETVAEKPAFSDSFASRRCLIPASAWYEWTAPERGASRTKQAWLLWPTEFGSPDDQSLFAFAGIWTPVGGESAARDAFVVLTTAAHEAVAQVHHRMPVVLRPEEYDLWLNSTGEDLASCIQPGRRPPLEARKVSSLVNSVANESSRCILPDAGLFG